VRGAITGSPIDKTPISIFPCSQGNFPLQNLIGTAQGPEKAF
jgi:hypothetical protein